jgi:hypothetical protein
LIRPAPRGLPPLGEFSVLDRQLGDVHFSQSVCWHTDTTQAVDEPVIHAVDSVTATSETAITVTCT